MPKLHLRARLEQARIYFWYWMLNRFPYVKQQSHVGNRYIRSGMLAKLEVTITIRDTREDDGYSREELLRLLRLIREEEARCEWTVPEEIEGHNNCRNAPSRVSRVIRMEYARLEALGETPKVGDYSTAIYAWIVYGTEPQLPTVQK